MVLSKDTAGHRIHDVVRGKTLAWLHKVGHLAAGWVNKILTNS